MDLYIDAVDILDEEGDFELPVHGGRCIDKNFVGGHMKQYDSLLVLSHFKGHPMGGFGGALKNISIGIASSRGKQYIHGAGDMDKFWGRRPRLLPGGHGRRRLVRPPPLRG